MIIPRPGSGNGLTTEFCAGDDRGSSDLTLGLPRVIAGGLAAGDIDFVDSTILQTIESASTEGE